jgi:putative acetyltransferase
VSISIHTGELGQPDVAALLALHVAAMQAQSPADACHVLPGGALAHPSITFYAARRDGMLLGVGALKALGNDEGEVKSMRTAPEAVRQGAARALLAAIIGEARTRGYRALRLETGRSPEFDAANALYDRAGFRECGTFGDYPESPFTRFMTLAL